MNSSGRMRILLDSTYLLPIVGVDVVGVERVIRILKKLRDRGDAEYYYTQYNILEILGKLGRIRYDVERVRVGLLAIEEEFKQVEPSLKGWLKALELRSRGFRDLIDLLLYATSLTHNLIFLTRDKQLIEFLKKNNENTDLVVYEEEFIKKYG